MAKGDKAFTQEEIAMAYPPIPQFFANGVTRNIVVLDKEIIKDVSKKGKEYVRVNWTVADVATGETKEVKYDFNFTNAMQPFKEEMRLETSVYRVTPFKIGERGNFEVFGYDVEYVGEGGSVPAQASPDKEKIDLKDIPF